MFNLMPKPWKWVLQASFSGSRRRVICPTKVLLSVPVRCSIEQLKRCFCMQTQWTCAHKAHIPFGKCRAFGSQRIINKFMYVVVVQCLGFPYTRRVFFIAKHWVSPNLTKHIFWKKHVREGIVSLLVWCSVSYFLSSVLCNLKCNQAKAVPGLPVRTPLLYLLTVWGMEEEGISLVNTK